MRGIHRSRFPDNAGGFTLTEVLVASLVGAVVAWGTASAFLAAARMMRTQNNSALAEAASYAQQTLERNRNLIACAPPWFDENTCVPTLPVGWQPDPLTAVGGGTYEGGTESILHHGAERWYCVTPEDCDGDGTTGDCFKMVVQVCWDEIPSRCPAAEEDPCP